MSEFFGISLSYNLGRHATIFQAEFSAISVCSEVLVEQDVTEGPICISVDSQAALKALAPNSARSKSL